MADTKRIIFVVCIAAVAALIVMQVDSIANYIGLIANALAPVGYGAVFAYLSNLVMVRIEPHVLARSQSVAAKRARRPLSILISLSAIFLVFGMGAVLVAIQLKGSVEMLGQGVTQAWSAIGGFLESLHVDDKLASLTGQRIDWNSLVNEAIQKLGGGDKLVSSAVDVGDSVARVFVDIGLGLVLCVYFLMAKERVARGALTLSTSLLPPRWSRWAYHAASVANECFSRFIAGQLTEAVILGTLCAAGMWVLGLPHALTIGVCVGASALIPVFGAWIGGIVGALMILPVSLQKTVVFLVFLIILQMVENHVIYPRTMGNATGVSSIWVISAIIVGGSLAGFVGIMLAVPCVATASRLLDPWWKRGSLP